MYAYDFETHHWSQIDCTGGDPPSGRSSLVAQVYENCLYIFGGYNGTTVLNDFYKFRLKPIGVPPPALVADLSRLINQPDLSDLVFLVEGQPVYAHRSILAIRSEYFRVMLCGGMKESRRRLTEASVNNMDDSITSSSGVNLNNNSSNNNIITKMEDDEPDDTNAITLPDVSYEVFLKVLEFLYTDSVRDVSLETAIYLLMASELFLLDRLKALCEDLIRRDIQVENVIQILVASHRHNAMGLKEIALEFILRHLNDPAVMSGLSDLRVEPDLLLEIIKRKTTTPLLPSTNVNSDATLALSGGPFGSGGNWDAR
jgi:leucine-zipper-like transcriptional regulator 1